MQNKIKLFNLKYICLAMLLILLIFCLCGCAEINFVTYHNEDGSITEYIDLTLNEKQLSSYGEDVNQISIEIPTNCHAQAKILIDEYHIKLENSLSSGSITSNDYVTYYNGIKIVEQPYKNGKYSIGLKYNNSSIYKKYYELMNNVSFSSKGTQVKKTFYTKTYYYGTANYGDYTIFNKIYDYYANSRFSNILPSQTTLNYTYSVSSKRYHSDADSIQMDNNGNYLHTWKVNPDEPARAIYFYTMSANRSMWIIVCIISSLILCILLCIIGIIKHFNNKSNLSLDKDEFLDNNEY